MAENEHLQIVREYEAGKQKDEKFGRYADVLVQMYVEDPVKFTAEFMMSQLVKEHTKIGFEEMKSKGDGEK